MQDIEVVSDERKKIVTRKRTRVLKAGQFTVTEEYRNYKLLSQNWSINGGWRRYFPKAYEPRKLGFRYYEDIDFGKSF